MARQSQRNSNIVPFPRSNHFDSDASTERAQDLAYQALEAPTAGEARRLADRALKLDPDCVDALIIRAETLRLDNEEYLKHMRKAVQAGEKALGQDFIRRNQGRF